MSAAPEAVTVACPREGCEWTFVGEPDQAKLAEREHELVHEADEETAAYLAEQKRLSRKVGAAVPKNGKTATDLANEERELYLTQTLTVRCADCAWETTGPAREARREWAEHRRDAHEDDSALASVERMDAGPRRTSTGKLALKTGSRTLEENLAATRKAGGGAGSQRTATVRAKIDAGLCKRPGCENRHIGVAMGPYAGLCQEHIDEAKEERSARLKGKPRGGREPEPIAAVPPPEPDTGDGHEEGQNPPPIAATPAPEPPPAEAAGTAEGTLVDLARDVEKARNALHVAEAWAEEAREELRAALEALDAESAAAWQEAAA